MPLTSGFWINHLTFRRHNKFDVQRNRVYILAYFNLNETVQGRGGASSYPRFVCFDNEARYGHGELASADCKLHLPGVSPEVFPSFEYEVTT